MAKKLLFKNGEIECLKKGKDNSFNYEYDIFVGDQFEK